MTEPTGGRRRYRLTDCNPRWIEHGRYTRMPDGMCCGIWFDCPEGHAGCSHAIPFTPSLCGEDVPSWQANSALWQRFGDTFETLTLMPSIRRKPVYADRDAAIAAGALPEYLEDTHFCAMHINITAGQIEFHGDSR